jgi:hypothetical protein
MQKHIMQCYVILTKFSTDKKRTANNGRLYLKPVSSIDKYMLNEQSQPHLPEN